MTCLICFTLLLSFNKIEIYSPGDWIVSSGDVGTEMYFISQGSVEVVVGREIADRKVVATLGEGGFFGEIALLFESKRTASIKAKTYCDLFVLRKSDLDKTLKSFPEQRVIISEMAEVRMSNDSLRTCIPKAPLFQNVEPHDSFTEQILSWFQPKVFEANEFVYNVGDPSESLYFIGFGTISFLNPDGTVKKQLKITADLSKGNFFGDADFLLNRPRTIACKTTVKCTLLVLDRRDYETVVGQFPLSVRKAIEQTVVGVEQDAIIDEVGEEEVKEKSSKGLEKEEKKTKGEKSKKNQEKEPKKQKSEKIEKEGKGKSDKRKENREWLSKFQALFNQRVASVTPQELADVCKTLVNSM